MCLEICTRIYSCAHSKTLKTEKLHRGRPVSCCAARSVFKVRHVSESCPDCSRDDLPVLALAITDDVCHLETHQRDGDVGGSNTGGGAAVRKKRNREAYLYDNMLYEQCGAISQMAYVPQSKALAGPGSVVSVTETTPSATPHAASATAAPPATPCTAHLEKDHGMLRAQISLYASSLVSSASILAKPERPSLRGGSPASECAVRRQSLKIRLRAFCTAVRFVFRRR